MKLTREIQVLNKIKELADEAVKLQNKNRMDEVLREISAMCTLTPFKEEDGEAEMIADNQGVESTVITSITSAIETVVDGEKVEAGAMVVKTGKGVKQAKGVKADE